MCALLVSAASIAGAQIASGNIYGTVVDEQGGVLPGAVLVAWLLVSCLAMPLGFMARQLPRGTTSDRIAWTGLLAAGSFSSLFVLTLLITKWDQDTASAAASSGAVS